MIFEGVLIGIAVAGHVVGASLHTSNLINYLQDAQEQVAAEQELCTFGDVADGETPEIVIVTD